MAQQNPNRHHHHHHVNVNAPGSSRMKKRKDLLLQHFHHDFPSLLPSPKSPRLDAELWTIMEEEDTNVVTCHEEEEKEEEEDPAACAAEERAIVVYDPAKTAPLLKSPTSTDFPIIVNSDLIPGLKDYLVSWGIAKPDGSKEHEVRWEKSSEVSNDSLAVVPWCASNSAMASEGVGSETGQPLVVEEGEMMEMDEPYVGSNIEKAMEIGEKVETVGASSPWLQQEQHCMMFNVLQNTSTPIHWCYHS